MEWQDWLEKTEPTGLTARQKKLAKEIADGDKDDHTQYYTKNDVNKILGAIAGAVGGASKVVGEAAGKIGGSVGRAVGDVASNPVVQEGVGNAVSAGTDKVDNLVEDVKNENQTGVSKAWETWLEKNDPCWEGYEQYGMKDKDGKKVPNCIKKNNAIETSHKEGEKKEEWNGKFDNSTTRDDAENDDDKAIGEEESLEELTDGKLEEVEKLKSWQIFLKGFGGTEHSVGETFTEEEAKKRPDMQKKNPPKYIKRVAQDPENAKFMTDVSPHEQLGSGTDKRVPTKEELNQKFNERVQPEKNTTRRRASPAALAARRARMKSWELWIEKGVTYEDPDQKELDPKKIMENAKNAKTTIKLDAGMKKSWNEWLEKMQGAGDARFGNQHLTGMEQKPVADDESIELSAESEENNEKQEKTEDKEDKDNKPYKALSQE